MTLPKPPKLRAGQFGSTIAALGPPNSTPRAFISGSLSGGAFALAAGWIAGFFGLSVWVMVIAAVVLAVTGYSMSKRGLHYTLRGGK